MRSVPKPRCYISIHDRFAPPSPAVVAKFDDRNEVPKQQSAPVFLFYEDFPTRRFVRRRLLLSINHFGDRTVVVVKSAEGEQYRQRPSTGGQSADCRQSGCVFKRFFTANPAFFEDVNCTERFAASYCATIPSSVNSSRNFGILIVAFRLAYDEVSCKLGYGRQNELATKSYGFSTYHFAK